MIDPGKHRHAAIPDSCEKCGLIKLTLSLVVGKDARSIERVVDVGSYPLSETDVPAC